MHEKTQPDVSQLQMTKILTVKKQNQFGGPW